MLIFLRMCSVQKIPKAAIKDSFEFERALGTLIIALYPVMPAFCAQLWQYFRDVANLTESEFDLVSPIVLLSLRDYNSPKGFDFIRLRFFFAGKWSLVSEVARGWPRL